MPRQNPESPKTVLGKVRVVLDQFSVERPFLTLTEIIDGCGLPKPTVFRLLQELTELGFVAQKGKSYRLGLVSYRLGMVAKQQFHLEEFLDDLLAPLAQKIGETIITATLENNQIMYLHVVESKRPLRYVVGAGARRDIPFGATSMALLCQLSDEDQRAILHPPFQLFTEKTITSLEEYLTRLKLARDKQIVMECGEYYDGIMAIAVPIFTRQPLSITVVGPEERVRPNENLIVALLRETAVEFGKIELYL
ncbi:MAG: IclR family transcriptional regulator [Chloroflexota bacterium]